MANQLEITLENYLNLEDIKSYTCYAIYRKKVFLGKLKDLNYNLEVFGEPLEIHIFNHAEEYRYVKNKRIQTKSDKVPFIKIIENNNWHVYHDKMLLHNQKAAIEYLCIDNYYTFDQNGMINFINYQLKENCNGKKK